MSKTNDNAEEGMMKNAMHEVVRVYNMRWGYNLVSIRGIFPFLSNAHRGLRPRRTGLYLRGLRQALTLMLCRRCGCRTVDFFRGG